MAHVLDYAPSPQPLTGSSAILQMRLQSININGIASFHIVYKKIDRNIVQTQYTAQPYPSRPGPDRGELVQLRDLTPLPGPILLQLILCSNALEFNGLSHLKGA